MTPQDFDFIANLLKKYSGFSLKPTQLYLLENRLAPVLRQNNLSTLEELVTALKLNDIALRKSVIEAVSVSNTRFFRNKYVFETIRDFVQEIGTDHPIKILSAGCAGGQEPVSIALLMREMDLTDADVWALDMSHQKIDRAKTGVYSHYEVQKGLPIGLLLKYFSPQEDGSWHVNEDVMHNIHYKTHNLMSVFSENNFDIVLCRNMLSFMTEDAQDTALKNLHQIMRPDGMLIIGAVEVLHTNPYFERDKNNPACYHVKKS